MTDYATLADFNAALERAKINMPGLLVAPAKAALNNMAGAIRQRVSATGETQKGGSFSPYSSKYAKRKQKSGSGTYGKKTDRKNFYFSGNLWDSYMVSYIEKFGDVIKARVDFIGNNVFKSNRELNEIHSDTEGQGIGYPNDAEELKMVAELETAVYMALDQLI
jgi:hypothetical protein